ncbi:ankyrin repeat protein [Kribbella amoyensis]|uniref:Ankyrin repeat protein n=1 Tax=Kribbella amoyensis TaxID=996641 RepID=A0A561BNI7_9ACTN|nr:ankyrin repeat domain-containing protein [Kribbella amoyensis]TWD80428.1 ankyrin repeat protein [Kribbella amoyensis]
MPTRKLPDDPNLDHLRQQAKTLLKQVRADDPGALALAEEFHPVATLADAQLVIARSYGFPSWPRLVRHLELVDRYSRSPHRQTIGGPLDTPAQRADEFLRLATLHYGQDDPARQHAARKLLDDHPDVALSNIYTLVVAGRVEAVRAELQRSPGLAVREGGPYRWQPLLYLTYSRLDVGRTAAVEVAKLLLEHGADPNAGYLWQGLPSPFTAVTGVFGRGEGDQPPHPNRGELAQLLLEAGADPNDSQTMYNCGPGCPPPYDDEHLELLLEFGLGHGDGGPWHERLTVAHPTPRQLVEDELVFASSEGLLHRVELVLAAGVDPEGRGTEHPIFCGHRAYELAAVLGHEEVAALLLEKGAAPLDDVHELFAAVMRGESVDGVDPDLARRAVQRNPYLPIRAAQKGRTSALRLLQQLGFDLNVQALTTPLHDAAFHGHLDTVRELVALGADPARRDPMYNGTPRNWAEHNHQQEVVDYLSTLDPVT